MAARKKLSNVVAVSEDLDERHFLGRLATFTLPDEARSGAKLSRAWARHGLDVNDLPEARQPVHIFQSACASVKTRRGMNTLGERIEVRADEVTNNARECAYQITVAVWDLAARVIEHEKAMRVTFDKQTSSITVDRLGYQDVRLDEIEAAIRAHFDANARTVPGQKVRNAVRNTLLKIGAQNLRRKAGGLYFVPVRWQPNGHEQPTKPILDGLAAVLDEMYGDRADFYTIPLVNSDAQKAMVRKHFALNVNEKARELAQRAINRVRAADQAERGVRSDMLANLYNERRKLHAQIEQFDQLVSVERKSVAQELADLDSALSMLQELADKK
jgi:hypothetical protein